MCGIRPLASHAPMKFPCRSNTEACGSGVRVLESATTGARCWLRTDGTPSKSKSKVMNRICGIFQPAGGRCWFAGAANVPIFLPRYPLFKSRYVQLTFSKCSRNCCALPVSVCSYNRFWLRLEFPCMIMCICFSWITVVFFVGFIPIFLLVTCDRSPGDGLWQRQGHSYDGIQYIRSWTFCLLSQAMERARAIARRNISQNRRLWA